jgi:hypothetical protein
MKTKQKTLKAKGFISTDGKADINMLSMLSALTTLPIINELHAFIVSDKIKTLSSIYEQLAFLYDEEKYTEAARFLDVIADMSDTALPDDVKLVLSSDITKEGFLCEFIEDFYEILDDYRAAAGYRDSGGGECIAAYGSVALRF